jgi:predicted transcriptional regulator
VEVHQRSLCSTILTAAPILLSETASSSLEFDSVEQLQQLFPAYEEAPLLQKEIYRLIYRAIRQGDLDDTTFVEIAASILGIQMAWLTEELEELFEQEEPCDKQELAYYVSHLQFLGGAMSYLAAHPPSNIDYKFAPNQTN